MEAPRKGDHYLLTQHRHRLSSVQPSSCPRPSKTQLLTTWSSFTTHELQPEKLLPIHANQLASANELIEQTEAKKMLQTHEPELLNPAHHNHALSRALSKRNGASVASKVVGLCKPSSYLQGLEVECNLYMRRF